MAAGTGKTRAAVEILSTVDTGKTLWVTKFRAKQNINTELEKWGFSADVVGIESISASSRIYLELLAEGYKTVVIDESLTIKNLKAKRTWRLINLGKGAEYKLILNGTPVAKNLLDLWSQMEFLSPKILGMRALEYKNTFCEYTQITEPGKFREYITGYENLDYLYALIGHYVYECELVLDREKSFEKIEYVLPADDDRRYETIKYEMLERSIDSDIEFLAIAQKLLHSVTLNREKMRILKGLLSKHGEKNVIIFTAFVITAKRLQAMYPDALVLSYQKHSFSLNLQDRNVTIFFDKTWCYALRSQAMSRTYRKGQERNCHYIDMTSDKGLDLMIDACVERKKSLLDELKSTVIESL